MKCEHILIMRFSALGDIAMTIPVVYSLAKQYPNVRIAFLSRPFAAPLFEHMPPNVTFMGADVKGEYKGVFGLNKLYRRLVAKHFTAIADLHDTLRSKYLRTRFDLCRMNVQHINKHKAGRKQLVRKNDKVMMQQPSQIDNYRDVLARLGYPVDMTFHSLFPQSGADLSKLPRGGEWCNKKTTPWIGVAPFAGHKGKEYPATMVRDMMKRIASLRPDARIFVFGGKAESDNITEMCDGLGQCINVAGHLGLSGDLALISHLDLMVSMDSANMHLASLTATPVISIWGATHPYCGFLGYGQKKHDVVQCDMPCRPCSAFGSRKCYRGDYACMTMLKPEDVAEKVVRKLEETEDNR